ncbi:MAG: FGGY-family carbohydrate kinase [Papillibacter sp.]|nr:FGGY-family carbohydrate kinase [Papillibacter sp.]
MLPEISKIREEIAGGATFLGVEFGSTRIKAVLIDREHKPLASGSHTWENKLVDNLWTYSLEDIWDGLRDCYRSLAEEVKVKYGLELKKIGAMGFSGMMHGYMAFDSRGELLVPFRTWRNTNTEAASTELTKLFDYNIPQRWSIAHLYQAVLNNEEHVKQVSFITTIAGYIHWKLSGKKLVGVGEASGIFPLDASLKGYDLSRIVKFHRLIADRGYPWKLKELLPDFLLAGENAGYLTEEGARLLDPSGVLLPGCPLCPPEGDAETGMVATNSVAPQTGNISAGTSVFAMIVLDRALSKVYPEVDMVTTPTGLPVAMVHCNNCTSDINSWIELFGEFYEAMGHKPDKDKLYNLLYSKALEGDFDCGGLLAYNYVSGEQITGFLEGRPLLIQSQGAKLSLGNLMKAHLFTALGGLRLGMNILEAEGVSIKSITGHGGFFKVKGVGQKLMAAAVKSPVTVMSTAGEGGPWGMAILAAYMICREEGEALEAYLDKKVFSQAVSETEKPEPEILNSFNEFMKKYVKGLAVERAAVEAL